MKAYVEGYGCSLNKADTQTIQKYLQERNFQLTENPEQASIIIINTCAVKDPTENKMIKRIHELNSLKKKTAKLLVVGCLPKINRQRLEKINGIEILGAELELLGKALDLDEIRFSPMLPQERENRFVSIIPICRGCLGECAYCATRFARGKLESYSINDITKAFKKASKNSKEIWITAEDTGCYGKDIGESLPRLLKKLLETEGDYRIRIGMMNPYFFKMHLDELIEIMHDKKMFKFLHIPVQAGSDKILKAMNRHYSKKDFIDSVKKIKEKIPGITIATDVIVGFPGETDRDFKETVSMIKETRPVMVNISRFGARPNTSAEKMPDQILPKIKRERSRILAKICPAISKEEKAKMIGKTVSVVFIESGKHKSAVGRTENYIPLVAETYLLGKKAEFRVEEAFTSYLKGKQLNRTD